MEAQVATDWIRPLHNVAFCVVSRIDELELADSSDVIIWNPNICILCGRCIRACAEISKHQVLDFANRGDKTVVTAEMNELLGESSCYSCAGIVATPGGQHDLPM